MTIDLIKQKHGNVSAYLRGLIARDLGEDALPAAALKRRRHRGGETDLNSLAEIGKPKSRKGARKHANGSANHRKVGRVRAAKKKTNQNQ